jgi:segregation and condensation protein B
MPNKLSQAALETLAIIAYNEPITRMKIDNLRGVTSVQIIRKLVAKGFIKESGRSNLPGRPILYETTNEFLDYFGLSSKEELPKFEQIKNEIVDDTDLYESTYKENE